MQCCAMPARFLWPILPRNFDSLSKQQYAKVKNWEQHVYVIENVDTMSVRSYTAAVAAHTTTMFGFCCHGIFFQQITPGYGPHRSQNKNLSGC